MAIDCAINSDEQAQIQVLRKEIHELKEKLQKVTEELEESKTKVEEAEKKEASKKEDIPTVTQPTDDKASEKATKAEERIERLQQINASMQQMFVEKMEKANLEHDLQVQRLKIEIAQLNTEIAKQ